MDMPATKQELQHHVERLIEVTPEGGKLARAHAVSPQVEAGNIYLPHPAIAPWIEISWRKRPRFPNGRDDDQVDALTQELNRMRTHHGHFSVPESQIVLEPFCSAGLTDPYALADSQHGVLAPSEAFPRAKAAAIKTVALDSTLGEAHISLAWCLDGFGWDWKSGEREFTRGIELSLGYATGHHWYGIWPRWGDMEKP